MEVQLYNIIPLTFSRITNGSEVTGLSVTVKVLNAQTGLPLLGTTAMTEVTPGTYEYTWNSGITVQTHCKAFYVETGNTWVEYFDIEDIDDTVESRGGRLD